ncbi:MAG: hypothetical protein PVF85_03635 [Anaerolineales bacterium]
MIKDQDRNERPWWTRFAPIILGVLWFVWIGIEDRGTTTVLLVSAASLTAIAAAIQPGMLRRLPHSRAGRSAAILLVGLVAGLLVTPTAVLLMAVKLSLHNHLPPDFNRADMVQVLGSTPAWAIGALLLAAAAVLYDYIRMDKQS